MFGQFEKKNHCVNPAKRIATANETGRQISSPLKLPIKANRWNRGMEKQKERGEEEEEKEEENKEVWSGEEEEKKEEEKKNY